jgi:hypothetical protein
MNFGGQRSFSKRSAYQNEICCEHYLEVTANGRRLTLALFCATLSV